MVRYQTTKDKIKTDLLISEMHRAIACHCCGTKFDRCANALKQMADELAQAQEQLREAQKQEDRFSRALINIRTAIDGREYPKDLCIGMTTSAVQALKQRSESAEAKNRELTAQMAVYLEALIRLVELKRRKDKEGKTDEYLKQQPIAWENANKVLANLPAEAEKMMRVVEAAEKLISFYDSNEPRTAFTGVEQIDLRPLYNAFRDLREGEGK